jgi:hypothetical protein
MIPSGGHAVSGIARVLSPLAKALEEQDWRQQSVFKNKCQIYKLLRIGDRRSQYRMIKGRQVDIALFEEELSGRTKLNNNFQIPALCFLRFNSVSSLYRPEKSTDHNILNFNEELHSENLCHEPISIYNKFVNSADLIQIKYCVSYQ